MTTLTALHAQAAAGHFELALTAATTFESADAAETLDAACVANWCRSRLDLAEEAYLGAQRTSADAVAELGADHPVTLETANDLARASRSVPATPNMPARSAPRWRPDRRAC